MNTKKAHPPFQPISNNDFTSATSYKVIRLGKLLHDSGNTEEEEIG
jgi:hypothetical protein